MSEINSRRRDGNRRAFTLKELLVVIATLAVLSTVALAAMQGSDQTVLRSRCAGNLRQIGVALHRYAVESNDYLPASNWDNGDGNPWQTYEAYRVWPGTGTIITGRGPWNLAHLYKAKLITKPKLFYCPAQTTPQFTYDYYATATNGWPSTPAGSGDDNVRVGYSYYPQSRITVDYYGPTLPEWPAYGPRKLTEVNPQKSITTDVVARVALWSHLAYGSVAGLNALFPDGRVVFQNARSDPQNFDLTLWDMVGNDPLDFRIVMNNWKP